jgi:hypothetical protein
VVRQACRQAGSPRAERITNGIQGPLTLSLPKDILSLSKGILSLSKGILSLSKDLFGSPLVS